MKNKYISIFFVIFLIIAIGSWFFIYKKNINKTPSESIPYQKSQVEEKFWVIIDWWEFEDAYSNFESNFSFVEEKLSNLELDSFYNHEWVDVFLQMAYICKKFSSINPENLSSVKNDLKIARPFLVLSDPTDWLVYDKNELTKFNSHMDSFLYTDIWYNKFYQSISSISIDNLIISKNKNVKKLWQYYLDFYSKINDQYNNWNYVDCKQLLKDNYFLSNLSYE